MYGLEMVDISFWVAVPLEGIPTATPDVVFCVSC